MPIYVSLATSWHALYDSSELEQVHDALKLERIRDDEEYGSAQRLNWDALISTRLDDKPPWFDVPYDEGQDFTAALSWLCDELAGQSDRLEFIPDVLYPPLELALPDAPTGHWRIYSSEIMAMRWLTPAKAHNEFERLAMLYCWDRGWSSSEEIQQLEAVYGPDMDIPSGDRLEVRRRARAYYIKRLGDLADISRRAQIPAYVRW